jgi:hypothetical protein
VIDGDDPFEAEGDGALEIAGDGARLVFNDGRCGGSPAAVLLNLTLPFSFLPATAGFSSIVDNDLQIERVVQ